MAKYNIHNKRVFISGVSSGIGRQLALLLIKEYNCQVFGVARNKQRLCDLKNICGDNLITYQADVSQNIIWKDIAGKLKETGFYPDIIINNAGIIHPFDNIMSLSDAEIEGVINTNYKSHIYSVRNLLPLLYYSKEPAIINVISAAATLPLAGTSIYSSSKRAALGFTEVLIQELKSVYVAAVLSGPVKTGLYSSRQNECESRAKIKEGIISKIGVSAKTEAKRILKCVSKRKSRIVSGIIAKSMDKAYSKFPSFSVKTAGFMTKLLPLKTFKRVFKRNYKEESSDNDIQKN